MTTRCWWWTAAMAMAIAIALPSGAATLPAGAAKLVPAGQSVIAVASADLTGDGQQDYAVALRAATEDATRSGDRAAPARTLLVLVATARGFVEAGRNTRVIFKADEGGQCDPFLDAEDGLVATGRFFTVQNGVSCGQHWTDYITFRYDRTRRAFLFHKRVIEAWELNANDAPDADALRLSEHKEINADPRKPVLLSDYTPAP